jgi:glutamine synthetase
VMETALYGLKKNKLSDEKLFSVKLDLARRLNTKGFPKETFGKLCSFIKMYVSFDNSELLPKLDTEIDTINKTVRTMGIIEAIQEERIRQATEEVTELVTKQVTQQVTQQILKENIQKLHKRGLTIEVISEMLEVSLEFTKEAIK